MKIISVLDAILVTAIIGTTISEPNDNLSTEKTPNNTDTKLNKVTLNIERTANINSTKLVNTSILGGDLNIALNNRSTVSLKDTTYRPPIKLKDENITLSDSKQHNIPTKNVTAVIKKNINDILKNKTCLQSNMLLSNNSLEELKNRTDCLLNSADTALLSNTSAANLNRQLITLINMSNTSNGAKSNSTRWVDTNAGPLWLFRAHVPWHHVSRPHNTNQTEIIQACKFEGKIATCSAEYKDWKSKLWFQMAESPNRRGINITVHERGFTTRVTFLNRVNGTDCRMFLNGTFHQICVKVYGYETDLGPTRVCLELGAAIFNKGVTTSDYGCFRFASAVRHENALEGERPDPAILNKYILANNFSNLNNDSLEQFSLASKFNFLSLLLIFTFACLLDNIL